MNKVKTLTLKSANFPAQLAHIADPPKQLYILGDLDRVLALPRLAVVGSRKVSAYGRSVTVKLAKEAAEQGIVIVSGLALGVDSLAHQAALDAGGTTVAVLPSGLSKIYPSSHHQLAERILQGGGVLITEYPEGSEPYKLNFIARNRLISGLSDAVLITEAATKSGSLHTANFALEQGRTVLVVPGNITSELSAGTNNLIKTGAAPVTELRDILAAMSLEQQSKPRIPMGANAEETVLLTFLSRGVTDVSELLAASELTPSIFNQTLTMLEITGKIRPVGAGHWAIT
jgi:DNA processing protein